MRSPVAPHPCAPPRAPALASRRFETPLGVLTAVASAAGLRALGFGDRTDAPAARIDAPDPRIDPAPGDHDPPGGDALEHLDQAQAQLIDYFAGRRHAFDLALDLEGTGFMRSVWDRLRDIPFGQTTSYAALARRVGSPGGGRAVGLANARNPVAVIVPCHRVIRSDGTLCGYAGGIHRKRWLLDHERQFAPAASGSLLFAAPRG